MKLQINSLAALERLIGGDSEVEIEIRGSVVQKFAERHLKAVANSDGLKKQLDSLSSALSDKASQQMAEAIGVFKTDFGRTQLVRLRPDVTDRINVMVQNAVSDMIREEVMKVISNTDIPKIVNQCVTHNMKYAVDAAVKAKMAEAAAALTK